MTDSERITHILEAIKDIGIFVNGYDRERFLRDELVKNACLSKLMMLSEAVTRLSDAFKDAHNSVE